MSDQYCIAMRNVPRLKERHTLSLILTNEERDEALVVNNLDKAIELASAYKKWHPEITFDIFYYMEKCRFAGDIFHYGTWRISKEVVRSV